MFNTYTFLQLYINLSCRRHCPKTIAMAIVTPVLYTVFCPIMPFSANSCCFLLLLCGWQLLVIACSSHECHSGFDATECKCAFGTPIMYCHFLLLRNDNDSVIILVSIHFNFRKIYLHYSLYNVLNKQPVFSM